MNPLIWLSGANKDVLARCPSERTKYMGVGGAVLTTGVLAGAACTLTMHNFVGLDMKPSIAVGVVWSLIILNLDRWLVSSMRRQDSVWANIGMALPRIALALIIGTVIAEPLLLRVFEPETTKKAVEIKQTEIADHRKELDAGFAKIGTLEQQRDQLNAEIVGVSNGAVLDSNVRYKQAKAELDDLKSQLATAEGAVICENEGTCGSGVVGRGPAYNEKVVLRDRLRDEVAQKQQELDALQADLISEEQAAHASETTAKQQQLDSVKAEIDRLTAERTNSDKEFTQAADVQPGLLDRMHALSALAAESTEIASAQWVLRIFIIALDTLPVLVKLFMSFGKPSLYDTELERWEQGIREENADEDEAKTKLRRRTIRAIELDDEAQAQVEENLSASFAQQVFEAKDRIQRHYIDLWEAAEMERVKREAANFNNPPPPPVTGNGNGTGTGGQATGATGVGGVNGAATTNPPSGATGFVPPNAGAMPGAGSWVAPTGHRRRRGPSLIHRMLVSLGLG